MSYLSDTLQVFVPTSAAPWNPNTEIITKTVGSIWELLGERIRPHFYCDGLQPWLSEEEASAYIEYCNKLIQLKYGPLYMSDEWTGLAGLLTKFVKHAETVVAFNVQHDWVFPDSYRVNAQKLVQLMAENDAVQIVRLHKRPLPQPRKYVDRRYEECPLDQYGLPLIRTDGWGDSPHFARIEHYKTKVLPNIVHDLTLDGGRYGVEGPVWRAYRKDAAKLGFHEAQRQWGSFLYGRFGDTAYVEHIGGHARKWRKAKALAGCK